MADTDNTPQSQDTPLKTGQSSADKSTTPKTYTEEQYLKAVSDERTNAGRLKTQVEAITKERDSLKSQAAQFKVQAEEAATTLEETEGRIADLKADLETLEAAAADNVDLAEIHRIKKEIRAERDKAKQERKLANEASAAKEKALDAERETWAATVAEAQEAKFLVDAFEIAEEFEGGDFERLKALCEKTGKKKRDEIQTLAEVLWTKKDAEAKRQTLVADSGVSSGGGVDWDSLTPKQRREETAKRLKQAK